MIPNVFSSPLGPATAAQQAQAQAQAAAKGQSSQSSPPSASSSSSSSSTPHSQAVHLLSTSTAVAGLTSTVTADTAASIPPQTPTRSTPIPFQSLHPSSPGRQFQYQTQSNQYTATQPQQFAQPSQPQSCTWSSRIPFQPPHPSSPGRQFQYQMFQPSQYIATDTPDFPFPRFGPPPTTQPDEQSKQVSASSPPL